MARKQLYPPSVDPGFPELPACPKGWSETTFAEVFDVQSRPIKLDPDGRYKLVVARRNRGGIELRSEVQGSEVLTKTQFETHEGDFLISRRQIIHGACGVVPAQLHGAVVSNEYSALRTKASYLMDYFRHFSHSPYFQRTCFHSSHGVDVEKMIFKLDEWLARPVQVPPIGEQRKIAAILSSVDKAIEKAQAVFDQVQVVKKGLMQELLTRGLPGRHKKLKQTEIGEIPSSWDVVSLGDVCSAQAGGTPDRSNAAFYGGDIPWVKSGEVSGGLVQQTDETLTPVGLAGSSARIMPAGSVLLAMYGATAGQVGRLGIDAATNQAVLAIQGDLARTINDFVGYLLQFHAPDLLGRVQGSGQPNLSKKLVTGLIVALPPIEEQRRIARVLDSVAERLIKTSQEIAAQKRLKQSLMSVLLTGELRVTP